MSQKHTHLKTLTWTRPAVGHLLLDLYWGTSTSSPNMGHCCQETTSPCSATAWITIHNTWVLLTFTGLVPMPSYSKEQSDDQQGRSHPYRIYLYLRALWWIALLYQVCCFSNCSDYTGRRTLIILVECHQQVLFIVYESPLAGHFPTVRRAWKSMTCFTCQVCGQT